MGNLLSRSLICRCAVAFSLVVAGFNPVRAATDLGGLDLDGYCRSRGYAGSALIGSTAYDWRCVAFDGSYADISMTDACAVQYGGSTIDRSFNFYNPYSWECWLTGGVLGGLNLDGYCQSRGFARSALIGSTAYDWRCVAFDGSFADISMTDACHAQYGGATIDRFFYFYNPYSWECWD